MPARNEQDPRQSHLPEKTADPPAPTEDPAKEEEISELPFSGDRYSFRTLTGKDKPVNMIFSVLSLLCGLAAIGMLFVHAIPALVCGGLAVLFSIVSRYRIGYFDGKAIAGIMLGVFALAAAIAVAIGTMLARREMLFAPATDGGVAALFALLGFLF